MSNIIKETIATHTKEWSSKMNAEAAEIADKVFKKMKARDSADSGFIFNILSGLFMAAAIKQAGMCGVNKGESTKNVIDITMAVADCAAEYIRLIQEDKKPVKRD